MKVKLTLFLIKNLAIMVSRGLEAKYHTFLTSALGGTEWSASCIGHFMPWERPEHLLVRGLGGHCREGNSGLID
jgi:hypothetical protein